MPIIRKRVTSIGYNNRGFSSGPRQLFDVTCSECGEETKVPFQPDGTRPVFCRDCYQKKKQ